MRPEAPLSPGPTVPAHTRSGFPRSCMRSELLYSSKTTSSLLLTTVQVMWQTQLFNDPKYYANGTQPFVYSFGDGWVPLRILAFHLLSRASFG